MSLPMLSGSCWTKRTTESNRTAPEILRGFFAPYPPADASCRTSGHTPPNPLTADLPATQDAGLHVPAAQPATFPVTSSPIPAHLSSPSPASPKAKPDTPHASPPRRHRPTRPSHPARYPRRSPAPPFPHGSSIQARSQSKARYTPRFPVTQAQTRTSQLPSPLSSLSPAPPFPHISPAPLTHIKIPEADRLRDFFISGSVRSPSQRRLR